MSEFQKKEKEKMEQVLFSFAPTELLPFSVGATVILICMSIIVSIIMIAFQRHNLSSNWAKWSYTIPDQ